ncbi:hypothetical protein BDV96DRAFT_156875 [Lophiotrema nucula]|uniref:Uncharacterized protein n=1 Tax=Lophiotrema nucula TaxID=690887 RepID=A0A6A5Z1M8_9PLEO|nr:hypothetical protein BDV96DRAFT_156875 [Lophiotrema nucula]
MTKMTEIRFSASTTNRTRVEQEVTGDDYSRWHSEARIVKRGQWAFVANLTLVLVMMLIVIKPTVLPSIYTNRQHHDGCDNSYIGVTLASSTIVAHYCVLHNFLVWLSEKRQYTP